MRPFARYFLYGFFSLVIIGSLFPSAGQALPLANENGSPGADTYCQVGQVWPGYDLDWIEPGTITGGGQTFAALFDPAEGCDCPLGFQVSTIDFYMTFPVESPLPVTITVSMSLREAIPDQKAPGSWLPGATLCETPVRAFTFYIPKEYVGFGIALDCECLVMGGPAFLFFTIHSEMDPPGGFYTDGNGAPGLNRFFTLADDQWVDLVETGTLARGDLVISAFARCCEPPVADSVETWGAIKALYR
jgi:hypothetical protein